MSYSSKKYQTTWKYDPQGTTHNDRIGQILARGVDLRSTLRQGAEDSVKTARAFEEEQKSLQHAPPVALRESEEGPKAPEGRGLVWVDSQGTTLGSVTTETFQEQLGSASPLDTCNEKQLAMATMNSTQRSMHLWRKVNPGCMASTTNMPNSAMKDQFVDRDGLVSKVDKTVHRRKTEFTDYVEAKVKFAAKVG